MPSSAPEAWQPKGIDELEPTALDALRHNGSACVVAGPGSGKTEFLAQLADYLLSTGLCRRPRNILAISFKRDAARNLADRVRTRSPEESQRFHSMTFDAFTKGIVDRFRAALPDAWKLRGEYEIRLSTQRAGSDFVSELAARNPKWRARLYELPWDGFLASILGAYQLPIEPAEPGSASEFAVLEWWNDSYRNTDPQLVDFVMLNRLAELIIRSTPQLRRALRLSYPFIFVDEFQDTTFAQYSFLRSVFGDGGATVTAVGDNKQRIMGWAGALDDAFQELQRDFYARAFELEWNFRSSEPLTDLQHVVAKTLDPSARRATSKVQVLIEGNPSEIWRFTSEEVEARHIASWISQDVTESGRSPARYALLARQKASDFEELFLRELGRFGIAVRNDDQLVGRLRLQDLLADELGMVLLALLRLSASHGGNAHCWIMVSEWVQKLRGETEGVDGDQRTDQGLTKFVRSLRRWMRSHNPSRNAAHAATDRAMSFLGADAVQRCSPAHRTADALDLVVEAFKARMSAVASRHASWVEICDLFEGRDAVPLMTVHKSKGLEYHTVFFLSIDDAQWWSFRRQPTESTATFFVGLSRAEQRTIFTYCEARGDRANIDALYRLLAAGGAVEIQP